MKLISYSSDECPLGPVKTREGPLDCYILLDNSVVAKTPRNDFFFVLCPEGIFCSYCLLLSMSVFWVIIPRGFGCGYKLRRLNGRTST
jgi:hypothetical protein